MKTIPELLAAQPLGYAPGKLDLTAPARIWLQIDATAANAERSMHFPVRKHDITWNGSPVGGLEVQYVRADLAAQPASSAGARRGLVADLVQVMNAEYDGIGRLPAHVLGILNTAVERLAALPELLAAQPAAHGMDLGQFRPAVEQWKMHAECRADEDAWGVDWQARISEADRLLGVIDSQHQQKESGDG